MYCLHHVMSARGKKIVGRSFGATSIMFRNMLGPTCSWTVLFVRRMFSPRAGARNTQGGDGPKRSYVSANYTYICVYMSWGGPRGPPPRRCGGNGFFLFRARPNGGHDPRRLNGPGAAPGTSRDYPPRGAKFGETTGLTARAAWDARAYEPGQPWSTQRFQQATATAGGAESTLHRLLQNDFTDRC